MKTKTKILAVLLTLSMLFATLMPMTVAAETTVAPKIRRTVFTFSDFTKFEFDCAEFINHFDNNSCKFFNESGVDSLGYQFVLEQNNPEAIANFLFNSDVYESKSESEGFPYSDFSSAALHASDCVLVFVFVNFPNLNVLENLFRYLQNLDFAIELVGSFDRSYLDYSSVLMYAHSFVTWYPWEAQLNDICYNFVYSYISTGEEICTLLLDYRFFGTMPMPSSNFELALDCSWLLRCLESIIDGMRFSPSISHINVQYIIKNLDDSLLYLKQDFTQEQYINPVSFGASSLPVYGITYGPILSSYEDYVAQIDVNNFKYNLDHYGLNGFNDPLSNIPVFVLDTGESGEYTSNLQCIICEEKLDDQISYLAEQIRSGFDEVIYV